MTKARPIQLFLMLAALVPAVASAADPAYSPKLSLRVGNGLLTNSGTAGGGANAIGALNILMNYFVSGEVAFGVGYATNHPFSSVNISSRYYFSGQGTRSRQQQDLVFSERRDTFAHYVGLDFSHLSYILTSKTSGSLLSTASGSSTTGNLTLGMDYQISRHFELTAEANMGLMVFATSNELLKMKGYILNTGFSYIW